MATIKIKPRIPTSVVSARYGKATTVPKHIAPAEHFSGSSSWGALDIPALVPPIGAIPPARDTAVWVQSLGLEPDAGDPEAWGHAEVTYATTGEQFDAVLAAVESDEDEDEEDGKSGAKVGGSGATAVIGVVVRATMSGNGDAQSDASSDDDDDAESAGDGQSGVIMTGPAPKAPGSDDDSDEDEDEEFSVDENETGVVGLIERVEQDGECPDPPEAGCSTQGIREYRLGTARDLRRRCR
jgi:hypothetical protein